MAFILISSLCSSCQEPSSAHVKLIVIRPDTAYIDPSLDAEKDSVELGHLRSYYECLKASKNTSSSLDTIDKTTGGIDNVKNSIINDRPGEAPPFRYFYLISQYSRQVYEFIFKEEAQQCIAIEVASKTLNLDSLRKLSQDQQADYIIFFTGIHTIRKENVPILYLTTSVFSKRQDRIIYAKETAGTSVNSGKASGADVMWVCDPKIKLSCLLINAIKSSSEGVIGLLVRQWDCTAASLTISAQQFSE